MRNYNKEKLTDKDKALLRYVDNVKNDDPDNENDCGI